MKCLSEMTAAEVENVCFEASGLEVPNHRASQKEIAEWFIATMLIICAKIHKAEGHPTAGAKAWIAKKARAQIRPDNVFTLNLFDAQFGNFANIVKSATVYSVLD